MREILIRGKNILDGEWHFWSLQTFRGFSIFDRDLKQWHTVKEKTIGQYTGLKDKNGKRIFEGDLVQPVLPPSISQPGFVWPIMPVVFLDGAFGLEDPHKEIIPFRSFAPNITFEVKGNIHDNPDLLKGE